jgi:hypothetical protein
VAADRKYRCKKCDVVTDELHKLGAHAREVHGMKPGARKGPRKKKPAPVVDRETLLLAALVALFERELAIEQLPQEAYDRTIEYLRGRYGTPPAEPETEPAEDETP